MTETTETPLSDEALRQGAAVRLVGQLDLADALAARCEMLAGVAKGDRIKPIVAGARLMTATAQAARALALLANVEHRKHAIVETIQRPDQKTVELNLQKEKTRVNSEGMLRIFRRMNELVEQSVQARMGAGGEDRLAELIKIQERRVAELCGIDPDKPDDDQDDQDPDEAADG